MERRKGELNWFIPDGFIPPNSTGNLISHEAICVLNCNEEEVFLEITIYFEDRPPLKSIPFEVKGKRTKHIKTSSLQKDGEKIPIDVPYAIEIESDLPIIVQYSRLDTTQRELALMSTMAYSIK
ncbi:sensory rhodopsin transducer [Halalkalibacter alkalisediminis]|uniref:Sensory rhodopsin transducer n=1 Tax=Halalkalibacter alkalisediminis TaxID=935616 RepID=A0ABV6NJM4_9BACI